MFVGISGRMGVGKSTFAVHIVDRLYKRFGLYAKVFPIAGSLKQYVYSSLRDKQGEPYRLAKENGFELDPKQVFQKPTTKEIRYLLRECNTGKDPAHWIKEWLYEVARVSDHVRVILADDVRFEHERDLIRRHGICFFVWRKGFYSAGDHPSERLEPDNISDVLFLPEENTSEYVATVNDACDRIIRHLLKR